MQFWFFPNPICGFSGLIYVFMFGLVNKHPEIVIKKIFAKNEKVPKFYIFLSEKKFGAMFISQKSPKTYISALVSATQHFHESY